MQHLDKCFSLARDFIVSQGDHIYDHWSEMSIAAQKDSGLDVASNFDVETEQKFSDLIQKHFPEHGFVGEELPELSREGEYTWDIDPIDGTKYFVAGVPLWCVTLGLRKGEEQLFGVTYNPITKQLYEATKGNGALLNGKRIHISCVKNLADAQITVDFAGARIWSQYDFPDSETFLNRLGEACYRMRMIGSSALSLAWLSQGMYCGMLDMYRAEEKLVDIRPGLLIATEAGAEYDQIKTKDGKYITIVGCRTTIDQIRAVLGA